MRVIWEGDKNTIFLKPIPKGKRGVKKKMTNFEKVKNMSLEEMAQFLEEISSSCYATNGRLQKSGKYDFCKICPVYVPGEDCNIKIWLEREAGK